MIHPMVTSVAGLALVVSGRALRHEEFLHLEDAKERSRRQAHKKKPQRARPGTTVSRAPRRWRRIAAAQRKADARNRRVRKQALSRSARLTVDHLSTNAARTVAIGDPGGDEEGLGEGPQPPLTPLDGRVLPARPRLAPRRARLHEGDVSGRHKCPLLLVGGRARDLLPLSELCGAGHQIRPHPHLYQPGMPQASPP